MTHTAGEHPRATGTALPAAAFLVELTMLTVLALSGAAASENTWLRGGVAIVLPVIAASIWAVWMAPASTHRLANPRRLAAQVALFVVTAILAAVLLAPWVGVVFLVVAIAVFGALAGRD